MNSLEPNKAKDKHQFCMTQRCELKEHDSQFPPPPVTSSGHCIGAGDSPLSDTSLVREGEAAHNVDIMRSD